MRSLVVLIVALVFALVVAVSEAGRLGAFSFLGKRAKPELPPVPFGVDPVKWKGFLEFQQLIRNEEEPADDERPANPEQHVQEYSAHPPPASPFNDNVQTGGGGAGQLILLPKRQHADHDKPGGQPDDQPHNQPDQPDQTDADRPAAPSNQLSPFAVAAINRGMPEMRQGMAIPRLPWSSSVEPVAVDKQPLTESELRIVLKELYVWSNPLTAEQALEKLESIDSHYPEIKDRLPIDSHKLISFSQEIELRCQDEPYLVDMIETKKRILKEYRSLTDYINECISSFLEICDSKLSLDKRCHKFAREHEKGWRMLEDVHEIMERHKRANVFSNDSIGVTSLQDFVGMSGKKDLIVRTVKTICDDLISFTSVLRMDAYLEVRTDDRDFDWFMNAHAVCKKLDEENFMPKMRYF